MESIPAFILPRRAAIATASLGLLGFRTTSAEPAAGALPAPIESILPELDRIVAETMQRTGVPGLAAAVVHQNRVIYLKGFGVRAVGGPETQDPDTVFPLASVSKPIASTVMAALVGDGVIAWDDPITTHFPAFEMFDPWPTRAVSPRRTTAGCCNWGRNRPPSRCSITIVTRLPISLWGRTRSG